MSFFDEIEMYTLTRNGTVQRISLYEEGFTRAFAMGLQYIDSLDRVFDLASWVDGLYCKHGIDGQLSEEVVVARKDE